MLGGLTPHPELTAHAAHPDLWLSTCSLWFVPYTWSLRQGREVGREDGARGRMVCVWGGGGVWWWWGASGWWKTVWVVKKTIWVVKKTSGWWKNKIEVPKVVVDFGGGFFLDFFRVRFLLNSLPKLVRQKSTFFSPQKSAPKSTTVFATIIRHINYHPDCFFHHPDVFFHHLDVCFFIQVCFSPPVVLWCDCYHTLPVGAAEVDDREFVYIHRTSMWRKKRLGGEKKSVWVVKKTVWVVKNSLGGEKNNLGGEKNVWVVKK